MIKPAPKPGGIDFSNWSYNALPERTGNVSWQPELQDLIYTAINHVEGDYEDADENCAEQLIERLVLAIKGLLVERESALRSATIVAKDTGERRAAAKKLLCDICACAAETDPASLDLPHVIKDRLGQLETLIAERDACLFMATQTRRFLGQDGLMVLDAIGEAAAAKSEAARVRAACDGIADDFMTSEAHHPGYVLIPTEKFEAIRAALSIGGGDGR